MLGCFKRLNENLKPIYYYNFTANVCHTLQLFSMDFGRFQTCYYSRLIRWQRFSGGIYTQVTNEQKSHTESTRHTNARLC